MSAGLGCVVQVATVFTVYEVRHKMWENDEVMTRKIPATGGMEMRTFVSGTIAGIFRAILECPFEYVKTKRQTG